MTLKIRFNYLYYYFFYIMKTIDIVIARYQEDISWLKEIPEYINIYVYNKNSEYSLIRRWNAGRFIITRISNNEDLKLPDRAKVVHLQNIGRESDTYLTHIIDHYDTLADITIFCQGDPFPHSPDFLKLLNYTKDYKSVQPLTDRYLDCAGIPPSNILDSCKEDYINDLRIYRAPISNHNLGVLTYDDIGGHDVYMDFINHYKLPNGTNVLEWIMKQNGFIINKSSMPSGYFCYAAIFAVNKENILQHPKEAYINLKDMHKTANRLFPSVMERLWLQLFE